MSTFDIDCRKRRDWKPGQPQEIAIRLHGRVLTRLMRNGVEGEHDYLQANPERLAFWLIDNWWRLRWESLPDPKAVDADWRMAHDLASIGGAVWPRVAMWSEGGRIGVTSKADPAETIAPIRYLENALLFISADTWEEVIDQFLEAAAAEGATANGDQSLTSHVARLKEERADPELADWRRVEAKLGYDPDEAPEGLMNTVAGFFRFYRQGDVEEALQAVRGAEAARMLQRELDAIAASEVTIKPRDAIDAAGAIRWHPGSSPWIVAEDAAARVRAKFNAGLNPLHNPQLAELLGVRKQALTSIEQTPGHHPFGLRLAGGDGSHKVILRSRWSKDRRFELARALGDMIWTQSSRLGVASSLKTDRQRFQRAFAQSLLCPFGALMNFLQTTSPSDEDMEAAGEHFRVNIKMIKTTLVNKKVIDAANLAEDVEAA